MNIAEFKLIAPSLLKAKVVPFLWGSQGIGKTETVRQVAAAANLDFVHLHMANLEVGDLVGLLVKTDEGTVKHARPEWFPTKGRGIIFLDELNRMHPDVMQAMFSFITSGLLHTHKLPSGWSIVAAGNYQDGDFQVTDTSDAAWLSRFCHIDFRPTVEEFCLFAESKGAISVADFIREQPEMLRKQTNGKFDFNSVTPDARAYLNFLHQLELDTEIPDNLRFELYQGLIGSAAAAAYLTFKRSNEKSVSIKLILAAYSEVRQRVLAAIKDNETRLDYLNRPVSELIQRLNEEKSLVATDTALNNLKQFLLDLPLELSQKVFKEMSKLEFDRKNDILNDMTYCKQIAAKVAPLKPEVRAALEASKAE